RRGGAPALSGLSGGAVRAHAEARPAAGGVAPGFAGPGAEAGRPSLRSDERRSRDSACWVRRPCGVIEALTDKQPQASAHMATAATTPRYTPEDLLKMPDGDRYELVDGNLVERDKSFWSSYV